MAVEILTLPFVALPFIWILLFQGTRQGHYGLRWFFMLMALLFSFGIPLSVVYVINNDLEALKNMASAYSNAIGYGIIFLAVYLVILAIYQSFVARRED